MLQLLPKQMRLPQYALSFTCAGTSAEPTLPGRPPRAACAEAAAEDRQAACGGGGGGDCGGGDGGPTAAATAVAAKEKSQILICISFKRRIVGNILKVIFISNFICCKARSH